MPKKKDLSGMRFGKLVSVREAGKKNGAYVWECVCDCGNTVQVIGFDLTRGHSKSCGCSRTDRITAYRRTHGLSDSRLYTIWNGMKERCYNTNATNYSFYGGKGVAICAEWSDNFLAFYEWAMKNGYKDELTIDRKDSNGDYCPSNCQWITRSENATRANKKRWAVPPGIDVTACRK